MKVILLKDVPRIGRKFDVKDVPDGHALNFLIPRKLALRGTPDAVARIEKERKHAGVAEVASRDSLHAMAKLLNENGVAVAMEANEQGGLFKSVHADDIAKAIRALGHDIEDDSVLIETPIKAIGSHNVTLARAGAEVSLTIKVIAHE